MNQLFPKTSARKASKLTTITLRDFGGGLDAVNSDIAMDPQFQAALVNFRRSPKGAQRARFGSNWFADVATAVTGNIVNTEYFSGSIIAVMSTGQIAAIDHNGLVIPIWSNAVAASLPGGPIGWSGGLATVGFVPFKNELIIHNGVDKPITIDLGLDVKYLQDQATGGNVNVPIGKFGCVVSNYHCVGGIPAKPTTIYISAVGTSGTFPGDPAPNDSISIDVGAYAPKGATEIRGIAGFRSNLIVFFANQSLVIKLGIYNDDGVHVPKFPDTTPSFGILGHKCTATVVNDLLFTGLDGFSSTRRNLYVDVVDSESLADRIEPAYRRLVGALSDEQLQNNCFMINNRISHEAVLYLPGGNAVVYNFNEKLRYRSWSLDRGPAWTCGCVTLLGRVFLAIGTRIFQEGNAIFAGENHYADRENDRDAEWVPGHSYLVDDLARDTFSNETFICIEDHVSGGVSFTQDRADQIADPRWELYTGVPVSIEMELPWIDGRDPMQVKQLRFIGISTKGNAPFMIKAWVDNLYKDNDGVVQFSPALTATFIGNDAVGFGYDAGPYGGGRRSGDPRLFGFPLKFKSLKIAIVGQVTKKFELATISFLFSRGKYHR